MCYECARCGFRSSRLSTYDNHARRKNMCQPTKSSVRPDRANVVIRKTLATGEEDAVNAPPSLPASSTTTINNNNNNNTNNTININILPSADFAPRMMHFPTQDLTHLTSDFKLKILKTVMSSGFNGAVDEMFGSLFFNPEQPHNLNVVMTPPATADGDSVTHVFGRDRRWSVFDTDEAILAMLSEHGDAIRNFPDEPGVSVSQRIVDAVDAAYDSEAHLTDPALAASLRDSTRAATTRLRAFMGRFGHIWSKLAEIDARAGAVGAVGAVGATSTVIA